MVIRAGDQGTPTDVMHLDAPEVGQIIWRKGKRRVGFTLYRLGKQGYDPGCVDGKNSYSSEGGGSSLAAISSMRKKKES